MGIVDNIYSGKLNQVNQILQDRLSRAGISGSGFSNVLSKNVNGTDSSASNYLIELENDNEKLTELANEHAYDTYIDNAAKKYDLDPNLIRAVIRGESRFKQYAKSGVGAMGLMQLMPGTAGDMGVDNAYNAEQNIDGGVKYLKMQINRFGDVRLALAAYNTGPSRVASYGITDPDDPVQYDRISDRVQNYVKNILGNYVKYSKQDV